MELSNIKESFDRVANKQKLSSVKSEQIVDRLWYEIGQALATIQSPHESSTPLDQKSILTELKSKLNAIGAPQQLEESNKELDTSIAQYQKLLENLLNSDISKAYRNVHFDSHTINQIIASNFYHQGLFELGDCIMNEAGEPDATALRSQFLEMQTQAMKLDMNEITQAMDDRNLEPAVTWVSANREKLTQIGASNLELDIPKLQFVELLQKGTQSAIIQFANTHLAPLAPRYKNEIRKLMGGLLYAGMLEKSPYSELMSPDLWEMTTKDLAQQLCTLMKRQWYEEPLSVVVAAGAEALPILLKLANEMQAKGQEWQEMEDVPVELGKEFQFHSIFVCPVCLEKGSKENPPMRLPCSHVLCKQTINELLSRSKRITVRCPFCRSSVYSPEQCIQLYF